MPLTPKVLQMTQTEAAVNLARLHREHLEELRQIARDPKRHGNHLRSRTHGQAIFDEICKTYRLRAEAIHDALARSLPFRDGQPFTVDDLAHAFEQLFEPERSKVLEHSRQRLAEIRDGSFINDTVTEANRLIAWFRTKAEHIAVDQQPTIPPPPLRELLSDMREAATTVTGKVTTVAYGRADSREDLDRAAEVRHELQRLQLVLPTIPDRELSAYSTKSLPIGTFLNQYGHAFSVLPDDVLARQFDEEYKRRQERVRENRTNAIAIAGVVVAAVGALGTCSWLSGPKGPESSITLSPSTPPEATATAPTAEARGNTQPPVAGSTPAPSVTIVPPGPPEASTQPATAEATGHVAKEASDGTAR